MTSGPAQADASPWWHPRRHADRRPALIARGRIKTAIRAWLAAGDFVEIDAPVVVPSPGNETHLHALRTAVIGADGVERMRYLMTSPEFAMKRLLAAGEPRIAAFSPVFRNREGGPRHAVEFTMLEWYRARTDYAVLIDDVAALAQLACRGARVTVLSHAGILCNPFDPYERLSVADAFARHAGIDLMATLSPDGREADADGLRAMAERAGVRCADDDGWSDVFARVLAERVEPNLGRGRLTMLDRYPAPEAALARPCADDPRCAERFEVYACGVELANGFGELTDAVEQRRRFEAAMAEKERLYGERYPIDEDFLAALAIMPPACGIALGFDRLVMLATAAPGIDAVTWAPVLSGS